MAVKALTAPRTRKRRGMKIGTIAIPFLVAVLLSTLVLGGVARYYYRKLTSKDVELTEMPKATASISAQDVNEILFVFKPDSEIRKLCVMLLHFDPVRKTEYCIGVPINLQVKYNDKQVTVEQCYTTYGASALRQALADLLGQNVARYIEMNSAGFKTVVDIFGSANVIVTIDDYGISPKDTSQRLDSAQLETLLSSNQYYSESERTGMIGVAIASLINSGSATNQGQGSRIAANLDKYFGDIVNAVSTDITAMDFSNHRHAIAFMFENTLSPARPFNIVGTEDAQGVFIINDGFVQSLGGILSTRMEPLTEEELAGDTISKSESSKSSN